MLYTEKSVLRYYVRFSQIRSHISRPKFRLETNSTMVWLHADGVSLILPDVRFGTVSLGQVTN